VTYLIKNTSKFKNFVVNVGIIIMFTTCEVVINNNSQIFATVHLFKSSHGYYLTEDKNKKHTQND